MHALYNGQLAQELATQQPLGGSLNDLGLVQLGARCVVCSKDAVGLQALGELPRGLREACQSTGPASICLHLQMHGMSEGGR